MLTKNAIVLFFILLGSSACQSIDSDPSVTAQQYIGLDENKNRKETEW